MFPSLAARETCVAETNFAARKTKIFLPGVKNIFASRTQMLCPKHMFPSLATPGNITRNIVSATLFPSLARPLHLPLCSVIVKRIESFLPQMNAKREQTKLIVIA